MDVLGTVAHDQDLCVTAVYVTPHVHEVNQQRDASSEVDELFSCPSPFHASLLGIERAE